MIIQIFHDYSFVWRLLQNLIINQIFFQKSLNLMNNHWIIFDYINIFQLFVYTSNNTKFQQIDTNVQQIFIEYFSYIYIYNEYSLYIRLYKKYFMYIPAYKNYSLSYEYTINIFWIYIWSQNPDWPWRNPIC